VSLHRYGGEGKFLVKTRSDCIRGWWIEEVPEWMRAEVKHFYSSNDNDAIWKDKKLYKTSWLALLVAMGISKKKVLDVLREKLSYTKIKIKKIDVWGEEKEVEEEVLDTWRSKKIKFITE